MQRTTVGQNERHDSWRDDCDGDSLSSALGLLSFPYPKISKSRRLSTKKYEMSVARHSSTLVAMSPKTLVHVSVCLYHAVMGLPVRESIGGLRMSKLCFPGEVSDKSFPDPWPMSSWMEVVMKDAMGKVARYMGSSDGGMKGQGSLGSLMMERRLAMTMFLWPWVSRMSLY